MTPCLFVLIVIRFLAVAMPVYQVYQIVTMLLAWVIASAPHYTRPFVLMDPLLIGIGKVGAGALLYFTAPWLARLITRNTKGEPRC